MSDPVQRQRRMDKRTEALRENLKKRKTQQTKRDGRKPRPGQAEKEDKA